MADLEELFRWLHRHPELAFAEVGATARVKELLTQADQALFRAKKEAHGSSLLWKE